MYTSDPADPESGIAQSTSLVLSSVRIVTFGESVRNLTRPPTGDLDLRTTPSFTCANNSSGNRQKRSGRYALYSPWI